MESWSDWARRNYIWVVYCAFFFAYNVFFAVLRARELSWWTLYFACFATLFIRWLYFDPMRGIRNHQEADRAFISSITSSGIPVELAERMNELVEQDRVTEALALALPWIRGGPE